MASEPTLDHEIVEGTDAHLHVQVHEPSAAWTGGPTRPVLLLHGFASSSKLNWADAGWLSVLADAGRTVITVDLPGHGLSAIPSDLDSYLPSRIRADLLQVLNDTGVSPVKDADPISGVDIIGYSFGARLAWELGGTQSEMVHRMVLGGPSPEDRFTNFDLPAARTFVVDGTPIDDSVTASFLQMASLGDNNMEALLQFVAGAKAETYVPQSTVPHQPLLLVAGEKDEIAENMAQLATLAEDAGGSAVLKWLPARTHVNAITSRAFKTAAIEFLAS